MISLSQNPCPKLVLLTALLLEALALNYPSSPRLRFYAQNSYDLKLLAQFESQVAQNLTKVYIANNTLPRGSEIRQLVKLYLLDFYESSGYTEINNVMDQPEIQFSNNPVCAYRLLYRVKQFLAGLISQRSLRHFLGEAWKTWFLFFWKNGWPNLKDIEFATVAILRIQSVYDFDVKQFAGGNISATYSTNCTLHSVHCYEIGNVAVRRKEFASAIEWLELAKEMAWKDQRTSLAFAELSLRKSIDKHNSEFDEEVMMHLKPKFFNRKILQIPRDSKKAKKLRNIQLETFKGKSGSDYEGLNFWAICSGENFQKQRSLLFCWYEFGRHASLRIGPMKMEFLSRNPDVVQMYDVIQENEIQRIISAANTFMNPSSSSSLDTARTSIVTWYTGPTELALSKKIGSWTGLEAGNPGDESTQITSYSFGGHYDPHPDSISRSGTFDGRIATFMLYLNDVEEGGLTAFTTLGVGAKPVKGSAVFWYNLFSDGTEDLALIHGACPLIAGEKWAANKWIRYSDQFWTRKCGLVRKERFQILVNNNVQ